MERIDGIFSQMDVTTSTTNTPTSSGTSRSNRSEVCPHCGGLGFVRRDVPIGHPDFGRAIPCSCKQAELAERMRADLRRAGNVASLGHMTFDRFLPGGHGLTPEKQENLRHAYDVAQEFAAEPNGWLVLKGGYGCGKTHLAAAIANECLAQGRSVVFVVVPDLLDHLRATYSPGSQVSYDERFETIREAPILVLDDLGTQSATSWAQEKLFQIFNSRYNAALPTVITTNHELEEIDIRLRSRMADPRLCRICTILAPDFRQSGGVEPKAGEDISSLALHADQTFERFDLRVSELEPDNRENLRNAYEVALSFAQKPDGWLLFTGTYGCGKTHLAAAIANYHVEHGGSALFVVVPDLLDHLRATYSPTSTVSYDKRFDEIRNAPLLVLDDLGTESATPWAKEKLFQIFNHRYVARLPTVITTSIRGEQLVDKLEPRLGTRILDVNRCIPFIITAPSYHTSKPRGTTGAPQSSRRGTARARKAE